MVANKVLLFEVWNECNNACKFCSNKYIYDISSEEKIRNLDIVDKKLLDDSLWNTYTKLGFIGGEFFLGQLRDQTVKLKYLDMIRHVNKLLINGKIKEYWTTATLTFEDLEDLWTHLELIDDKSKVWICTSYDTCGRFHSTKMLETWKHNMHEIKRRFPQVNINTTTILTGSFIEEYLSGLFSVLKFCNEFQTTWFNKPPMLPSECDITKIQFNEKVLADFFPKRKRFLEFLLKFKSQETDFEFDKLFNTELRADALIKADYHDNTNRMIIERNKETDEEVTKCIGNDDFEDGKLNIKSVHNDTNGKCVHNSGYTPYVDSDACFYCDKEMIRQL